MRINRNTLVDILVLVAVTVIAYFPVSAFLFSLKNDSLVQYLPFRYHLSESIQHGYFPFWSPYLYTGFPIHADMQGMTWNPIVLVISLVTRYNMSILQFEVMIYLVLAATGMYSLLKSVGLNRYICILAGISYMSCGFINGSASVIPWISSAAFIPFVFKYLLIFSRGPSLARALYFTGALSMLFLCGYPTFFIYTSYIIFALVVYYIITHIKDKPAVLSGKNIFYFFLSVLVFLIICSPAIISYWEFLPYYSRGSGITAAKAAQNPFTPFSSISYILPNLVARQHPWLETDTSMRNAYVGGFVFLLFCLSLFTKQSRWRLMILGVTLFSFLLSLGDSTPLHKLCYSILPLFDTFRHPGNIRLFTSIGIILLAACYANDLLGVKWALLRKKFLQIGFGLTAILALLAIYCIIQPEVRKNLSVISKIRQPKLFMEWIDFNSLLFIQCVLQLLFCIVLVFHLRRKTFQSRIIIPLIALNSIIFCWIALPVNFISQIRTKSVNQYVRSFPDGYPLPDLDASVEAEVISDSTTIPVYGYPNFYNKKITIQDHVITPTLNKDYEEFNNNIAFRKLLKGYPLVWIDDTVYNNMISGWVVHNMKFISFRTSNDSASTNHSIKIRTFNPNKFVFAVHSDRPATFGLFQQFNYNWEVKVNKIEAPLLPLNIAFMGTTIPAGDSIVEFRYRPHLVIKAMYLSTGVLLLLIIYLFIAYRRTHESKEK